MKFLFHTLSYYLKNHPLATNMALSTTVGFCGDIVCQTVYEPWTGLRPRLTYERLPNESAHSPFLFQVKSPSLLFYNRYCAKKDADGKPVDPKDPGILLDLRRSFVFSSFTFFFGVPYFLCVYRYLDRWISPKTITKKEAILKGFVSWIAAQITNPIFLTYVTAVDHFFIYRDGRDGRRRVMSVEQNSAMLSNSLLRRRRERMINAGESDNAVDVKGSGGAGGEPGKRFGAFQFRYFQSRSTSEVLDSATVRKMGYHYRFVENKSFNVQEFIKCVRADSTRKMINDFPDILRYGLVFWSLNWLPMFYYIPSHFRLAYSSAVQVVWSGIMSHLIHRDAGRHGKRGHPALQSEENAV